MKFEPITVMTPAAVLSRSSIRRLSDRSVSAQHLVSLLLAALLVANQLLLSFLGVGAILGSVGLAANAGLLAFMLRAPDVEGPRISLCRLAICIALAAVIFVLAGEGRFTFANIDWQTRDAVLRDMTLYPWPYAYSGRGVVELLRAPLGMYLIPALVGKAGGTTVAEIALLVQNSVLLGIIFALGSLLAETTRARVILLIVVIAFSGMDFVAKLTASPAAAWRWTSHLDQWGMLQFSSHLTQAFWVPQHAIAGWAGAVLFLLWQRGRLPLSAFLVPLPLLALWSPLALMGLMPLAAFAGLKTLVQRRLRRSDILAPAFAAIVVIPALIYLQAASDTVGVRFFLVPPLVWSHFQFLETIPFILGVGLLAKSGRPKLLLGLVTPWLAITPLIQMGTTTDFMMRASIPALAILSVLVAEALTPGSTDYRKDGSLSRGLLIAALAIGSLTGIHEIARALANRPAPLTRCDFIQTTISHAGVEVLPKLSTYLAPVSSIPGPLRTEPVKIVPRSAGVECWERPWKVPR